jgi:hypothetical protein
MSGELKDGGPAFPIPGLQNDSDFNGMTLRDYLAAKALAGMCGGTPGNHLVPPNAARLAYEYADAMIEARTS